MPKSDVLATFQTDSDVDISTEGLQDNNNRTPLLQVWKGVAIPSNTEASGSVTESIAGLIYLAPHPSSIRNLVVLPASGIANVLLPLPTSMRLASFAKTATTILNSTLIGVKNDLQDVISPLDQAAFNPLDKRGGKEDKYFTDTIAAVCYKYKKSQNDQEDRHKEAETINDNAFDTNSREKIKIR